MDQINHNKDGRNHQNQNNNMTILLNNKDLIQIHDNLLEDLKQLKEKLIKVIF